jgi:hypothetical protein
MRIANLFLSLILALCIVSLAGCGRVEQYGEKLSGSGITRIQDIAANPGAYLGKLVTVKGKINIECNTGCWFYLKDEAASLYINIDPSGFAIPQRVGRIAIVEGVLSQEDGKLTLTGEAVEIR